MTFQEKREQIMEQYRAERAVLENKFNAMYAPLFEKRADIVAGRLDVKAAEGTTHTVFIHAQKRCIGRTL
jgi:hypothetical protein